MSSLTGGIELAPLNVKIEADVASFKSQMEKAKLVGAEKAKEISKNLSSVTKVGEKLESVGKTMTKYVTTSLAGVGVAALKMSLDFESSFAKVSTLLDENKVDFTKYKQDILKASNETKIGVNDFSEAVYQSISAGVDQQKAIEFTTNAMKLAKGGFTEGATAVDLLTTAINAYNLSAEDTNYISDLLITTQNLGKTTVNELAASMGKVIPVAKSVNFDIKELSTSYAVLTKNGIATAEAGTYLKAMLNELGKSGSDTDKALRELTGKGFADLKKEGKSTTDILKLISKYAQENELTLKDMFGSVEAGSAALVLMNKDGAEYNEILKEMGNSAGATNKAFSKMDATPMEKFKDALNKLKNAGIQLGTKLIPTFEKIVYKVSDLVDGFSNLSEEQQENILKWGEIAMAVGPVLSILGKGMQTFVSLKSTLGGITSALGLFSSSSVAAEAGAQGLGVAAKVAGGGVGALAGSFGGVIASIAPFVAGAAAIGVAGYGIYKTLSKEVVPSVDLFADVVEKSGSIMTQQGEIITYQTTKISESTKEAVGSYLQLDEETTKILEDMYINSTTITNDTCNELTQRYAEMGDTITKGLEEDKQNDIEVLGHFFTSSVSIQEDEKVEILKRINELYDGKKNKVTTTQEEITKILKEAAENNRELTEEEVETINGLQEKMKEQAIKTLSENEIEANVILERMKGHSTRITAEQTQQRVKELNKSTQEAKKLANDEYEETIRIITRLRDEACVIQADQAERMIEEARKQKEGTIEAIENTRLETLDKMRELNNDLDEQVDTATGEILSTWEKLKRWWSGWQPESKDFYATVTTHHSGGAKPGQTYVPRFNGMDYVPYDGYLARLHKGERILTAEENKIYNNNNNNNGLTVNIENFINNRKQDIKAMAEELEFYRRQVNLGGGRTF